MSAWKACDIRGPFPDEVSTGMFRQIGGAVASLLPAGGRVIVAGDFRLSTPELKAALIDGLGGVEVLDAGQIPTPVAYFAYKRYGADALLIVTASHNPPGHNGLKLTMGALPPLPDDFERIRKLSAALAGQVSGHRPAGPPRLVDPVPEYKEWITRRWAGITPVKVVLDAGNGAWSVLGPEVFEALEFDVVRLYCSIDGRSPNRPPDSARAENLSALCAEVRRTGATLGIAWDGDGDRVAFVDETGSTAHADEMAVLLARYLLRPGNKFVYDIKLSDLVRREVEKLRCAPLMERSGHAFIKRRMIEEDAALGCEVSGHYFFRELGGGDDGLFTALLVSRMIAERGALSELRRQVPPIFATPDLRLRGTSLTFPELAERLRQAFRGARETTLDGLRLETRQGCVLIRESVTEPAFTLRVEGFTQTDFEALAGTCRRVLPEVEI